MPDLTAIHGERGGLTVEFRPRLPREGVNRTRIDPLRETALLLGGVVVVGGLLLFLLGGALDLLLPHVPVSWEVRLFRPFSMKDAEAASDDERIPPLQSLLDRLASHWPDAPYPLRIAIADEAQPNAFAVPGGKIIVTSGLLARAESENEVAFVLAHEIGHFAGRDHLRRLGRALLFSWVVGNFGGGVAPADLVEQLAARGFDRQQEAAADRFALRLIQVEYGHVAGALDFLQRLPGSTAGAAGKVAAYLSTHPVTRVRLDDLQALAEERGWPLTGPLQPVPLGLRPEPLPDHEQGEHDAVESRDKDHRRPQRGVVVDRRELSEVAERHVAGPPVAGANS
ncbi:MAG: M48 family metallopeptidase [Nitrospirota bacterium]